MSMQLRKVTKVLLALAVSTAIVLGGASVQQGSVQNVQAATPVVDLYDSAPDAPDGELQAIVENVVRGLQGDWGVAIKKLDTGQYATVNGDTQQVSASLYKMWVLAELYHQMKQGTLSLNQAQTVDDTDAYYDASLDQLMVSVGSNLSLRQAANLMITLSDNTAAHLLVRTLDPDNISAYMRQLGLTNSVLDWSGVGDNLTTPLDMLRIMEMIATDNLVDAEASREMRSLLLGQQINDLLPPGLPDNVEFAHKTGALDNVRHDAGIVYGPTGPYIIVSMVSNFNSLQAVSLGMAELASQVNRYFASRPSSPALYFPETREAVGHDFLKFWYTYGGLQQFGYPIGPEHMSGNTLVQEFERARFELHPENAGGGGPSPQVLLGLAGQERATELGLTWPRSPDPGIGRYFDPTGQAITGDFLSYWLNNGGERAFGFPISPAQAMISPGDGKSYMTQWFQRARLELHPELPPGHQIVLGTLVTEIARSR